MQSALEEFHVVSADPPHGFSFVIGEPSQVGDETASSWPNSTLTAPVMAPWALPEANVTVAGSPELSPSIAVVASGGLPASTGREVLSTMVSLTSDAFVTSVATS